MERKKYEKESQRPTSVTIDPKCLQEALRMYFQPIKNDDPKLDFYTMYKRETTEFDTEYMQKYNEDLNTTLIFAGLFSAVSSAFIIDIQTGLQPDSSERSEAYLRAILLTLNRSLSPNEDPTLPVWDGPPTETVTTVDLLYASLLISLLAAFVGMLGKQWLSRYLRHTGGSMVERCGDRQRKFDGLEKWSFHLSIESLPIMLQIALLLLASGLSRYMWNVNTSVARIIISFTVLGFLFYIGIAVAGTSSYACPFQTPASIALRNLRDSQATRELLTSLSSRKVISFAYATSENTRKWFVSVSLLVHNIIRSPLSWDISPSNIMSSIHRRGRGVGDQAVLLLLRLDRALGNTKYRLAQKVRKFRRATLLPVTANSVVGQHPVPDNGPGLRLRVWDLEKLQKQNRNSTRCVCWILRIITDPEAVDSATCLTGNIRWFEGDSGNIPPFEFIVYAFETCFDSAKQLYPGMKDRAYFAARAILQINTNAKVKSREDTCDYSIPLVSSTSVPPTDPDFSHTIRMLECNLGSQRPTLDFAGRRNTHTHSLWMSNLFVDVTRIGPNPTLKSYRSYIGAAITNNQAIIANILLMWYMFLGGHVEEETFWAIDKSDSLEPILSHLSTRVMNVIADGNCFQHLDYLLVFLAGWKERPAFLTQMVSQWYSAIDMAGGRLGLSERSGWRQFQLHLQLQIQLRLQSQFRPEDPVFDTVWNYLSENSETGLSEVGPGCDPIRDASYPTHGSPQSPVSGARSDLFLKTIEIGFGLATPGVNQSTPHSDRSSHHEWMFKTAFSSDDDEVIADAMCAWVVGDDPTSCVRHLTERMGRNTDFSARLRKLSILAIENTWRRELEEAKLETIHLLESLNVDVGDMGDKGKWTSLLRDVVHLAEGREHLSLRYWVLLEKLVLAGGFEISSTSDDIGVIGSLKGSNDWEKLEVWMVIVWRILPERSTYRSTGLVDAAKGATRELLSQKPSALERLENLCKTRDMDSWTYKDTFQEILEQAKPNTPSP